eukprot:scaffold2578_cov370-Prasinococcus_capsulatus_cf.AAC.4
MNRASACIDSRRNHALKQTTASAIAAGRRRVSDHWRSGGERPTLLYARAPVCEGSRVPPIVGPAEGSAERGRTGLLTLRCRPGPSG